MTPITYETYVEQPCPVTQKGMDGSTLTGDVRTQACLEANAQLLLTLLTPVLTGPGCKFAGAKLQLIELYDEDQVPVGSEGPQDFTYQFAAGEQRRIWQIATVATSTQPSVVALSVCEVAINSMWAKGVGAPGYWAEASYAPGTEPAGMEHLVWNVGVPAANASLAPQIAGLQLALSQAMHQAVKSSHA